MTFSNALSGAMRVLSPEEEVQYLRAAAKESMDLADVAMVMVSKGLDRKR
jgi:hypothetical protein